MEQWQEIRGGIEKNLGKRVWMKSHRGRSKCVENVGILEHSFPSIFTILIEEHGQEKRISYGYNELFTRQLEMKYLEYLPPYFGMRRPFRASFFMRLC